VAGKAWAIGKTATATHGLRRCNLLWATRGKGVSSRQGVMICESHTAMFSRCMAEPRYCPTSGVFDSTLELGFIRHNITPAHSSHGIIPVPNDLHVYPVLHLVHALCFLIAASSAVGLAPTTSSTFWPSVKIWKVGMARMPSSWATSGISSTSIL